ncbi:uncharacterized protein LOC143020255 [Oratosquilla oratoria]|uniref:uncharacterized protein LOC143020255 n=1 Tax=Oratosquilla oratoria TaxID=337810 RepID=UPI003F762BE7
MEVDQHLTWLLGAVKSSVDANGIVNEDELKKNVTDCFKRVRKALEGEKEGHVEKFKERACLVLLLSCPLVRKIPEIESARYFQPVILSFPILTESSFFSMIKSLNMYKSLNQILMWLPLETICTMCQSYLSVTKDLTLASVIMTSELIKCILCGVERNSCCQQEEDIVKEIMKNCLSFLNSQCGSGGQKQLIKFAGYYFMCLLDCGIHFTKLLKNVGISPTDLSDVYITWREVFPQKEKDDQPPNLVWLSDIHQEFLDLCQKSVKPISIDIWLEWSEITVPTSVTRCRAVPSYSGTAFTLQTCIKFLAFELNQVIEREDVPVGKYQELIMFMKDVAVDPMYDPDSDLGKDDLIKGIEEDTEWQKKLLLLLLRKPDIFECENSFACVSKFSEHIPVSTREDLLKQVIQRMKTQQSVLSGYIELVLRLAQGLPKDCLLKVVKEELECGQSNILCPEDFQLQLTATFNRVAEDENTFECDKVVWLCLQSGKDVVHQAVAQAVHLEGLAPIMIKVLCSIPCVCTVQNDEGVSYLASLLCDQIEGGFSEKEEDNFVSLVSGLLASEVLDGEETARVLVYPKLQVPSNGNVIKLAMPLVLLKEIISYQPVSIVTPGPPLVTLFLILVHILHAAANLRGARANKTLIVRKLALNITHSVSGMVWEAQSQYSKDLALLKQEFMKLPLHPRAIIPLKDLLGCKMNPKTCADYIVQCICAPASSSVPKPAQVYSNDQWILALAKVLPHSSEEEWWNAIILVHKELTCSVGMLSTLQVFQELLTFLSVKLFSDTLHNKPVGVSIHHCFYCFSYAAMLFTDEQLKGPADQRFFGLTGIFSWWCRGVVSYVCDLELPILFLARIVAAIEDLFVSERIQVSCRENVKKGCGGVAVSSKEDLCHEVVEECEANKSLVATGTCVVEPTCEHPSSDLLFEAKNKEEIDAGSEDSADTQGDDSCDGSNTGKRKCKSGKAKKKKKEEGCMLLHGECLHELNNMVTSIVQYVPSSNLANSVSNKLLKIMENYLS